MLFPGIPRGRPAHHEGEERLSLDVRKSQQLFTGPLITLFVFAFQKKDYYGACLDDDDLGGVASGDLLIPLDHSLPPSRNATLAKLYHSANHILSAESPDKVRATELRTVSST